MILTAHRQYLKCGRFFKKHYWSAEKNSESKSRTAEHHEAISRIGRIMDATFEQEARKRGLPSWSGYLDHTTRLNGEKYQDNPLIALRDSVEDLVSDWVCMLLTGPDETVESIFSQFDFDNPDLDKKADDFMHTAVGIMLDMIQYNQLAGIVQHLSAAEDFNPYIKPNFRALN